MIGTHGIVFCKEAVTVSLSMNNQCRLCRSVRYTKRAGFPSENINCVLEPTEEGAGISVQMMETHLAVYEGRRLIIRLLSAIG